MRLAHLKRARAARPAESRACAEKGTPCRDGMYQRVQKPAPSRASSPDSRAKAQALQGQIHLYELI